MLPSDSPRASALQAGPQSIREKWIRERRERGEKKETRGRTSRRLLSPLMSVPPREMEADRKGTVGEKTREGRKKLEMGPSHQRVIDYSQEVEKT